MAWDKYFLSGLQSGAELALKRKMMNADEKYREWQMNKEDNRINSFMSMFGSPQGMGAPNQDVPLTPPLNTQGNLVGGVGGDTPYLKVPDFNSPLGFRVEVNPAYKLQAAANVRGEADVKKAQIKASGNFARVASAVKQFSDYYAGSLNEGGSGNILKKAKGGIITQTIGGGAGEQMPDTGKLFGQRAELSLAMMPILTNQNRFIASIMEYINKSLPQGQEGSILAASKLEQTLLNQYTTAQALKKIGYDPEVQEDIERINNMEDDEAAALAKQAVSMSKGYKLTKEEKEEFEEIKKDVLGSLLNYKNKTKSYKSLWEQ